jgi:hypothetical protein
LYISYAPLTGASISGTQILSYNLEWDGDLRSPGEWISLIGYPIDNLVTNYRITHGVIKGQHYRFRYRARNFYGWGAYSDVATVQAAEVPGKPFAPTFVSSTDSQMIININQNVDNGGSPVF